MNYIRFFGAVLFIAGLFLFLDATVERGAIDMAYHIPGGYMTGFAYSDFMDRYLLFQIIGGVISALGAGLTVLRKKI